MAAVGDATVIASNDSCAPLVPIQKPVRESPSQTLQSPARSASRPDASVDQDHFDRIDSLFSQYVDVDPTLPIGWDETPILRQTSQAARTRENRFASWLPWLFALLAIAGLWWSLPQQSQAIPTQPVTAAAQRVLPAKPIREIQLGERIQGRNPLREQVERFEPDPATWRTIHLQMRKSAGGALTIALLRPIEWIEDHAAQPGSTVHLDLHEMGAVGEATVIAINDCPPIQTGVGTVVTGKFVHQCAPGTKLVYLRIEGQSEPTGVTDNHPYWSADRQDFVPVGELRVGELVETEFGPRRVQSIQPWTGFDGLLYNLETTEHVFRVGSLGSLVHNACDNVAQMANVRRLGREGEEAAGIVKNTKRIDSLTGTASHRVPDEIGETWIREVKNVKTLHFSSQLRDSLYTAIEEGKDFRLAIRSNTKLSARLREVIDASWIKLEFLD